MTKTEIIGKTEISKEDETGGDMMHGSSPSPLAVQVQVGVPAESDNITGDPPAPPGASQTILARNRVPTSRPGAFLAGTPDDHRLAPPNPSSLHSASQWRDLPALSSRAGETLACAHPVETEVNQNFPIATPASPKTTRPTGTRRSHYVVKGLALLAAVCCAVIVPLQLRGSNSADNHDSEKNGVSLNAEDNASVTEHLQFLDDPLKQFLLNQTLSSAHAKLLGAQLLEPSNTSSAQYKAFEWLQQDPNLQEYSGYRLRQRFALASLFYSTNGANAWTNKAHWLSYDHHECEWAMIPQSHTQKNVLVETNPCQPMGGEPWSNTSSLVQNKDYSSYKILGLRLNDLEGTMPNELYWLTNLERIALGGNHISGTLSPAIAQLTSLKELALHTNQISGYLPTDIGLLSNLTVLQIGFFGNLFSGTIPTEIYNLHKLETLDLSRNLFSGTISTELGLLTNLTRVLISGSSKMSPARIPTELAQLTGLVGAFLRKANLVGELPTELGRLTRLRSLLFGGNHLTGSIVSQAGQLKNLLELDLADNQLVSSLPTQVGMMGQLTSLLLGSNLLTSSLPREIQNLSLLKEFSISGNSLTGTLDSSLGKLSRMRVWNSASNNLSGTIPSRLASWVNITMFNVSDNPSLLGQMPEALCPAARAIEMHFHCNIGTLCGCECKCSGV